MKLMTSDLELLRTYATEGSDDAFQSVVERHVALVYSSALRQARDGQLAQEITQAVFLILARKAGSLRPGTVVSGWLFRATRFAAARALRTVQRRQHYEQEAGQMQSILDQPAGEAAWHEVAPLLDEALAQLGETDRHAVLLRFFERKELKEVGHALGTNEEAAKKRVARAVEKLRTFFLRRGAVMTATALAGALTAHAAPAASPGLSLSVAALVAAHGATATSTLALMKATMKAMLISSLHTAAALVTALLLAAGAGTILAQKAAETKASSNRLVHEGIVNGPLDQVWAAYTTKAGLESWMVAHAEIELKIGGTMKTQYDPKGTTEDPKAIVNTILSLEPMRMLSFKVTKAPQGFPFPNAITNMWTVVHFEAQGEKATRVREICMGFSEDDESRKMREFFNRGNAITLKTLQMRFAAKAAAK